MSDTAVVPRDSFQADKISLLQNQVNETTSILIDTMDKVIIRYEKLEDLEKSADNLKSSSSRFERQAKYLKHKMCWKNAKMTIALIAIILIVLLVIILSTVCNKNGC